MSGIFIKPTVAEQFRAFLARGRVLFFSAPCGCGKTALAEELLKGKAVYRLFAGETDFAFPQEEGWDILLIEDFQRLQEDAEQKALCEWIRNYPEKRFVLLSRGTPPGYLMAFQYAGLMQVLDTYALLFDREETRSFFQEKGVKITDSELTKIMELTSGFPLGIAITARNMAQGRPLSSELVAQGFREVFHYFETAVYRQFDLPVRRFLLELSLFESFDLEMVRMVSGDPRAGELLDWLQHNTTMMRYDGIQKFHFWSQFREFLLWEMGREYSEEKRRILFNRGGLYYELKEEYPHALDCYTKGGDYAKVSELLTRNAEQHPGMGHYYELEKYYRGLPESEILASPALMQGMSMLCSLEADYDASERWYEELKQFAHRCGKQDAAGKQARSRLAWLDISLPQRAVEKLTDTIPAVFQLMRNKEITLPPFSVTSTLPSIMNGGKDFSAWSKRDDFLYQTIRIPVEAVLGRDGVGLADCAVAESKFEKGEDISARILPLVSRMNEIQRNGTPDMEFVATGLLIRSQLASGQSEDARQMLETLRLHFCERGLTRFLPNLDAMLCRIALHAGDIDAAELWYREKAPRDPLHLNVMKRYQYLTQAMVELANGKPDAALLTLAPLEDYCKTCARHIDGIHIHILNAIALYRKREHTWQTHLKEALAVAEEYRFIRTISVYGAAVLPLLEESDREGERKWQKRLMAEVRRQAAYYPAFLEPPIAPAEELTATELQILRLICADKSNAEIGQIMDIKLTTVKTHVSHILDKLDVSRRSEAKTVAKKLRLIPEHL